MPSVDDQQYFRDLSLQAKKAVAVSNTCTVFAEHEVVSQLASGASVNDLIAGIHDAIAARVYSMVKKLKVEQDVAVTGGGAKNIGLVKALENRFGFSLLVPPEPLITGALGAALVGKEIYENAVRSGKEIHRSGQGLAEATFFS